MEYNEIKQRENVEEDKRIKNKKKLKKGKPKENMDGADK